MMNSKLIAAWNESLSNKWIPERGPQDTENKFKKINIDKLGMCNTRVIDKKPDHALCFS